MPALLQDAGKRHDAPLAETVARSPGSGLTRNIRSQPGSGTLFQIFMPLAAMP